jgi:RNA polymerase sigma-70 factor (ECF subfamily)
MAEELTQEAFVQAMLKIGKFEGRSSFASWLRSIALNVVRNHWRSQRSTARAHAKLAIVRSVGRSSLDGTPDAALQRKRRSEALYEALDRIPENLREVFVLRDVEGLDREDVASALGISPGNVSVRANRARQRIREELRSMGALAQEA